MPLLIGAAALGCSLVGIVHDAIIPHFPAGASRLRFLSRPAHRLLEWSSGRVAAAPLEVRRPVTASERPGYKDVDKLICVKQRIDLLAVNVGDATSPGSDVVSAESPWVADNLVYGTQQVGRVADIHPCRAVIYRAIEAIP